MNTKNKIILLILGVAGFMFLILILNIIYNFRMYGVKSIDDKAHVVAQTIKHALTSQMIDGVIENRELFLSQIENLDNIDKIWLSRGSTVIRQYGKGFNNEMARDKIDRDVLRTGKTIKVIQDNLFSKSTYRITIPYNATNDGPIDCLACHDAKVGDTLGAISLELSIDEAKDMGIKTVTNTTIISLILIIMILVFIDKIVGPFLDIFDSIKNVMKKARDGDYSARITSTQTKESKEVAKWINTLLEKLQITLDDIESKIGIFLVKDENESPDPLLKVKSTVTRLSHIYKFRKTIEQEESLEEIYARLADVIQDEFKVKDFSILQANTNTGETKIVYGKEKLHCEAICNGCRADRTNTIIDSYQFNDICRDFKNNEETSLQHLCIPYSISNEVDIIISISTSSKEETERIRHEFTLIKDYIDASRTEIISKKLMKRLEKTASTDPLTGLYNRKYLEDSIEQITSQADRAKLKYGVLMIDIDLFKQVNDTYGHDVGDEAIRILAQSLNETSRNSDILIRYGGEEFVALLYDCDEDAIKDVAEKMRLNFMSKKIIAGSTTISKTISIGTSSFPNDSDNFWQCIKFADLALYKAKDTGRNKVITYTSDLS